LTALRSKGALTKTKVLEFKSLTGMGSTKIKLFTLKINKLQANGWSYLSFLGASRLSISMKWDRKSVLGNSRLCMLASNEKPTKNTP
jgi:hypothetical protein